MKTAFIAAAALMATSLVSQADETAKYDGTFGMSLEGAYAWAGRDDQPDMGGGLLSVHQYIYSGSVISQVSLTSGFLTGSETRHGQYLNTPLRVKDEMRSIPLLLGYTLNVPLTEGIMFYVGGKLGVSFINDKTSYSTPDLYNRDKEDGAKFTYTVGAGFKFGVGEHTDIKIGYEQYRMQYSGSSHPYHAIQGGLSWNF